MNIIFFLLLIYCLQTKIRTINIPFISQVELGNLQEEK